MTLFRAFNHFSCRSTLDIRFSLLLRASPPRRDSKLHTVETRAAFCRGPSSFLHPLCVILPNSYKIRPTCNPYTKVTTEFIHSTALGGTPWGDACSGYLPKRHTDFIKNILSGVRLNDTSTLLREVHPHSTPTP